MWDTVFPFPSMEVHEQGLPNHPLWLPDSLWTKLGQGTVLRLSIPHSVFLGTEGGATIIPAVQAKEQQQHLHSPSFQ